MHSLSNTQDEDIEWLNTELPRNWLRNFLLKVIPIGFPAFIAGWFLLDRNEPTWYGMSVIGAGIFQIFLQAIAFANNTPLRENRLIRNISLFYKPIQCTFIRITSIFIIAVATISVFILLISWVRPTDLLRVPLAIACVLIGWLFLRLGIHWENEIP